MTKLSEYLEAKNLSQRQFADMVDVDPSIVSRLVKRAMVPSLALAARIQAVTRGAVTATSWVAPCEMQSINTPETAPDDSARQVAQTGNTRA